jgi:hypothetical protein
MKRRVDSGLDAPMVAVDGFVSADRYILEAAGPLLCREKFRGDAPLFRNRSGAPYSKDTLGDDFRAVRTMVFGKNDDRQLADIRRSGAVEATVGGAKVEKLAKKMAKKMANTISASARLQKVYNPVDVESGDPLIGPESRPGANEKPTKSVTGGAWKCHKNGSETLSH